MAVIIIGGGVIGLSAAYHLARRRCGPIVLLEKGPVGDGSSSRAAGIITGLLWSDTGVRVRKRCLELFGELSRELDGYQFQQTGCLNLFSAEGWSERQRLLPLYDQLQTPYEILREHEVAVRWRALRLPKGTIGLYDPIGGYSETSEYLPALAAKVCALGVEIREFQKVSGFIRRGGRIAGVQTGQGDLEADVVISTVYAWTRALLEHIDLPLPVKCFVHQRYVTQPLASPPGIPAVNANPCGIYFRPALGGRLLGGIETPERAENPVTSLDFHQSALQADPELRNHLRRHLQDFLPDWALPAWEDEKVGLLTFSMDGEPILGPVKQLPGLYLAVAFHSGGFAYNPAVGELLAQFVAEGRTSIDVSAFSPDRFARDETEHYLASTIAQKNISLRRH
jgi:glycine/D-amino acid oxidase-like deaminating enzyme